MVGSRAVLTMLCLVVHARQASGFSAAPRLSRLLHRISAVRTHTIKSELESNLRNIVEKNYGAEYTRYCSVTRAQKQRKFGDYQFSAAMPIAKAFSSTPATIANRIAEEFSAANRVGTFTVTGSGFVNIRLSDSYLVNKITAIVKSTSNGKIHFKTPDDVRKVVVDFSSPNIAKEMHVGHLRSTIIGDCISNAFEAIGHKVVRLNHVGDWGTQFGMLIHNFKTHHADILRAIKQENDFEGSNLGKINLLSFYKEARKNYDENLYDFQRKSSEEVVLLQSGNAESVAIWKYICNISRSEFQKIYDVLDVYIEERGESFYNFMLKDMVEHLEKIGIAEISQGATVVKLYNETFLKIKKPSRNDSDDNLDSALLLRKTDGGFLYSTTDLAALKYRLSSQGDDADEVVYVTDAGQAVHFDKVFAAARISGMIPQSKILRHVPFGLVLGNDGKKLRSRSGETIKLIDLINESISLAARTSAEKQRVNCDSRESNVRVDESVSRIMGIAAIKYADLSVNRESNYKYNAEKMTSLVGNTAPYMLYALVRIRGIRRRALQEITLSNADYCSDPLKLLADRFVTMKNVSLGEHERDLISKLACFDEVMEDFMVDLMPHKICDYIYELAQLFNSFYEHCPVINNDDIDSKILRTTLCLITEEVLELYLNILGIKTVDKL